MTPEERKKILLDSLQATIGVLMDDVGEFREAVPKSRNLAEEAIEFCDGVQEVLSWDMKRRLTAIWEEMDRLREEIDERTGELEHANQEAAAKDPYLVQEEMGVVLQYILDKEPDAKLRLTLERLVESIQRENECLPLERLFASLL